MRKEVMNQVLRNFTKCLQLGCIEDEVDVRVSEDESPIEAEDASPPAPHHRPPSYNPEDYAHALANYARAPNIYAHDQREKKGRNKEKEKSGKEAPEMSLKQFASLPEMLRRLREDLKTAYLSFVKELVREPHDGVSLLLDLLKMIQIAQANLSGKPTNREQQVALRRALIDEFECLACLRCCLRCADASPSLANYRHGLYCLAAATMSTLTRSRTLALQLLTKACETSATGHRQVMEAFATLRLRYAEPVKCKFLISMMLSHPHPSFHVWGLRFVNAVLLTASSLRERIYLQEEFVEAGFDAQQMKKSLEQRGSVSQQQKASLMEELNRWLEGFVDLNALEDKLVSLRSSNGALQQELQALRQANMKLLEENVLLKTVGGEVQEHCAALQRRLQQHGLPSSPSPTPSVTDSEVSSFVTGSRDTVRRNSSSSPNRANESPSRPTPDEDRSMSPEWALSVPCSSKMASRQDSNELNHENANEAPPVPKKRNLLLNPKDNQFPNEQKSVICNETFTRVPHSKDTPMPTEEPFITPPPRKPVRPTLDFLPTAASDSRFAERIQTTHIDALMQEKEPRSSLSDHSQGSGSDAPPRPFRPKNRNKSEQNNPHNEDKRSPLTSSTSSLSSASSSASRSGGVRKDPQYENLPQKPPARRPRSCRGGGGSDEGDCDYERDVVVYEAITLGNDTILMEDRRASTSGSKTSSSTSSSSSSSSSSKSSHSKHSNNSSKSTKSSDGPCVRQSVQHYENLATLSDKKEVETDSSGCNEDSKKDVITKLMQDKREGKKKSKKNGGVSDKEVEAVIDGFEKILRNAETSSSSGSLGTVKENPLLSEESFEDRSSPSVVANELEIVPSRIAPQLPPRSRSRGAKTGANPVIFLDYDSPAETSDTETLQPNRVPSPRTIDTESTKSFGWIKADPQLRRHDSFMDRPDAQGHNSRKSGLKRSESLHFSHKPDYNSHRSYSPRRRGSMELLVPLEESEIRINGRTYTRYTASQAAQQAKRGVPVANSKDEGGGVRRRNRSVDDRLDRWLDDDYHRQMRYNSDAEDNTRVSRKRIREDAKKPKGGKSQGPQKSSRNGKDPSMHFEMSAFNGFKNPTAGMRESDYGPNFMLNSPGLRLGEVLGGLVEYDDENRPRLRDRKKRLIEENPDIPTPDYSATPAGTLTNGIRHILDMPSGLY